MFDKKEYMRNYHLRHREEINLRHRKYYLDHREDYQEWEKKNREKRRNQENERHSKIRFQIIQLLGGKCVNPNCLIIGGCPDWRCLHIDHVNGGGNKERRKFKNSYQYYIYVLEQIKSGSKDYQLLCANCNWIKRYKEKELEKSKSR